MIVEKFEQILSDLGIHPGEAYRFPEATRNVILAAREEAESLKHNYVGTEHWLLALMKNTRELPFEALDNLGLVYDRVRNQVVRIVGKGDEDSDISTSFTPRSRMVARAAFSEAMSLNSREVMPQHLLLGLVRVNDGVAARVLLDFDLDSEKIRNEVIRMLSNPGGWRQ
jgi:ATP-dependent Clp protease ATP-binding subunit ClpC